MALSGSVATSAYTADSGNQWRVVLNWSASQSVTDNASEISWDLKVSTGSKNYVVVSELRVTIDGEEVYYRDHSNHTDGYNGVKLASGTKTLTHNTDGSKSMTIKVEAGIYNWAINKSGSGTFTLDTIPRASTIGASDANIGAKSTIVVTRKSTDYTHSIAYKFGDLTGYITASGDVSATEVKFSDTSISWTIPAAFYAQIPNAKTGTCTLTIKTYSGSTQIGDAKMDTLTVTAAQSLCAPSVSGSVVDSNATTKALTGDERKLVRYYSTALCTITATAQNSATISEKKIGGTAVSGNTRSVDNVEVDSFSFYVKDSRGYEASIDVDFTLVPYVILTNNSSGQRTDPTSGNAKLTVKGDYFNGSFGSVSNDLTIKYRFREVDGTYGSYTTVTPTISSNSYTVTLSLSGLDYEHAYEFEVVVSDKLATVTKVVTIKQGIPVFDWGRSDFRINVALRLLGAAYGTSLPATGKEGQVFFLLSNGSYTVKIHNGTSWV